MFCDFPENEITDLFSCGASAAGWRGPRCGVHIPYNTVLNLLKRIYTEGAGLDLAMRVREGSGVHAWAT